MEIKLTLQQRAEIKLLHQGCPKRKFADKLKAILLLDDGLSCQKVGRILLLDDDTIRGYGTQYINKGAVSLLEDRNTGTSPKLTIGQLEELDQHLTQTTYSDTKEIVGWVFEKFGVIYTISGLTDLIKRLGFVFKKPVLTPGKADVKKQHEFIEYYKELKTNLADQDQIYFVDGVHPQHNTIARYGWIKKGKTKHLKTNNGRQRTNINGALNLATKQVFYVEDERINAQTMIGLLKQMLTVQKLGKIHIILDNARYYHALLVKDFLKEHPRIKLHFLPPYSPNLNIIERLWHILKKQVVYNRFYPKFSDFKTAVDQFFKNKVWLNKEFENVLTDKFQIIKPDFSGSYL